MPPNEGLRALFRREGASLVKKHSRRILAFVIVVVLVFQLETLQQVTNMFENQYENINTTAVIDNEGLATTEPTLTNASMNSTVTNETTLKGVLYARSVSWDFDKWFFPNGLPRHTIVLDHNRPDNYFQLALENQFENVTRGMEPFQMMKEYIRDNGRQRLQDEWDLCVKKTDPHPNGTLARIHSSNRWGCKMLAQRTFVVGRYSCPYEAGNRLYKYMNSLLWAMVTGRTFLSGYWDWKACQDEIEEVPENYCRVAVTAQEDCDAILRLNEWVPQWDGRLEGHFGTGGPGSGGWHQSQGPRCAGPSLRSRQVPSGNSNRSASLADTRHVPRVSQHARGTAGKAIQPNLCPAALEQRILFSIRHVLGKSVYVPEPNPSRPFASGRP